MNRWKETYVFVSEDLWANIGCERFIGFFTKSIEYPFDSPAKKTFNNPESLMLFNTWNTEDLEMANTFSSFDPTV